MRKYSSPPTPPRCRPRSEIGWPSSWHVAKGYITTPPSLTSLHLPRQTLDHLTARSTVPQDILRETTFTYLDCGVLLELPYSIITVHRLLYLIYKLNFTTGVYVQEKYIYRLQSSPWFQVLKVLDWIPHRLGGTTVTKKKLSHCVMPL